MPLTPEDVVEKRFNPTRVREGYAQDEVDDFLDEVVAELRRLNGENAELRGQLNQCQARVAELTRAGAQAVPAEAPSLEKEPEPEPEVVVETPVEPQPEPVLAAAPAEAAVPPVAGEDGAARAAGVIALAQRLHDEYVREGESQRDALVRAAQEQAERVVAEAEAQRDRTLGDLEGRKNQLEGVIHELHGRETAYRDQLEHFIATQLEDLRHLARVVPDDAVTR
ncbi:DivIVA domain-containing protein [Kineococcus rhizosphaerae]|uniref:Cell wall synthesis protein Wag31 n=1 Tax=Kineococcus rhizosphaerae TaxID=559628 RepID=A0A2T0R8P8_9ACTN|nr:DivIVA domain-containing protein [Kineococcus rhizosphaerae]PRY17545.1 DivIVA domain-containing protein [Kineococcus rhizosphaerae]